jgi:hypothetical protein
MNFTIPRTTPPGKYLIRVEHMNISPRYNETQQFINCAQVEVTGEGGGMSSSRLHRATLMCLLGTPGPMIKFPSYQVEDPGMSNSFMNLLCGACF